MRNLCDLGDRLNRADLVVCQHNGDHGGLVADRRPDLLHRNKALAVHADISYREAVALQRLTGVQHGMMLDLAGDDMRSALFAPRVGSTLDRPVVGLAAAGGEIDLARLCAETGCNACARILERNRRLASEAMQAGRVAPLRSEPGLHRFKDLRRYGSRRRIVGVNKSCFHLCSSLCAPRRAKCKILSYYIPIR